MFFICISLQSSTKLCLYDTLALISAVLSEGAAFQSWISANPGLNFNQLFWFMHFRSTASQNFKKIIAILTQKLYMEKHVQFHKQAVEKFDFNIVTSF